MAFDRSLFRAALIDNFLKAFLDKLADLIDEGLSPVSGTATATAGAATLNRKAGTVTSEALTTAGSGEYVLTVTNSYVAANSVVLCSVDTGTNTNVTGLVVRTVTPAAGNFHVHIYNASASALDGTIKVSFLVAA